MNWVAKVCIKEVRTPGISLKPISIHGSLSTLNHTSKDSLFQELMKLQKEAHTPHQLLLLKDLMIQVVFQQSFLCLNTNLSITNNIKEFQTPHMLIQSILPNSMEMESTLHNGSKISPTAPSLTTELVVELIKTTVHSRSKEKLMLITEDLTQLLLLVFIRNQVLHIENINGTKSKKDMVCMTFKIKTGQDLTNHMITTVVFLDGFNSQTNTSQSNGTKSNKDMT